MKTRFLSLAALVSISFVMQTVDARPALAQNARFDFAEQYYELEQPRYPKRRYLKRQPSQSTVAEGSVPNASSILGFNPNTFAKAPQQYVTASAPPMVPMQQRQIDPRQFGMPATQVASPPRVVQKPQPMQPKQDNSVSRKNIIGKMSAPKSIHTTPVKRTVNRAPSVVPQQRVAKYNHDFYTQGPTNPALHGSHARTTSDVFGKLLKKE